ncbi:MAG: stage II sporulation protein M [Candidatus Verstraetearchaeota archaeon]|nr:stage II sporulation protein M [Candidatus Verstraetearchaeota archaeon]
MSMFPIKENLRYLVFSSALFILGFSVGMGAGLTGAVGTAENTILDELEPLFQFYQPFAPLTVVFLFLKNLLTASIAYLFSPIIIFPAAVLLLNGYVLGLVGTVVSTEVSLESSLAALVPHGIFEIPALIIAAAAGFRLGFSFLKKVWCILNHRNHSVSFDFVRSLRLFLLSTILLFIAAIMETYVTPLVMGVTP